ncbi:MAG: FAD-binding protein [Lentisphaeria bacterium]|nr:FAD-binding protein [Lentisphaeria bacterium]
MKIWNTIVIGSGAAGLSCACQLKAAGVDVAIYTEGLDMGTSFNTGSDKQTYYKLGMYGSEADSPRQMAQDMCASGSCHGDIAFVEAALSSLAFHNLVLKGVPFPHDAFGQHIGYKTDHDPRRRATSCGPYTSKEMCMALRKDVARLEIPVFEKHIAVQLLRSEREGRVVGAHFLDLTTQKNHVVFAENIVLATGGPGEMYAKSVYPTKHTGAIGLALAIGAQACNLQESQFGLASLGFRWNVSGSYLQALPRMISTNADGSDEREFLREYFKDIAELYNMIFLKGYQWPFAAGHVPGSSLVDLFVYVETELRHRKVWLDYRNDPADLQLTKLSAEAQEYLRNSGALSGTTPLARLAAINAPAIDLYREHGIDLEREPLEVGICAQHNNGGLAGNLWWESVNIRHLFVIGELNGSHGVTRPGGTALNAGQVGAFRAAEFIAHRYQQNTLSEAECVARKKEVQRLWDMRCQEPCKLDWREERAILQERMTRAGAFLRRENDAGQALCESDAQWNKLVREPLGGLSMADRAEFLRTEWLCFAQLFYLKAIFEQCRSAGSRGGSIVLSAEGAVIHPKLPDDWRMKPENPAYRQKVLNAVVEGTVAPYAEVCWSACRAIPETDGWFENVWKEFRSGKLFS